MRWTDRVYGDVAIDDPKVLALISCPTFQRLRGHPPGGALGVRLPVQDGHPPRAQPGGLPAAGPPRRRPPRAGRGAAPRHLAHRLLARRRLPHLVRGAGPPRGPQARVPRAPRHRRRAAALGFSPREFYDDSVYPLLERPLPWLCADRLDYFFRDGLTCGVASREAVARFLAHLDVVDRTIVFTDADVAREAVALFDEMNRNWWAGPVEAYIYNEFADALREGFDTGALGRSRPAARRRPRPGLPAGLEEPRDRREARPHRPLPPRPGRPLHPPRRPQEPLARPAHPRRFDLPAALGTPRRVLSAGC